MADFLQPGTMLREQYHVMRPLGQGGMGSVYLVEHTSLGKYYALKQMTLHNTPKLEQAFLREAKLLAHLEHPALPSVIDYFSTVEGLFLVMAYVEGPDLVELLHQNGRAFGWERVSPWAAQLLDVLDYLHSRAEPIVHRDIKPNNIKILPNGQLKLLDFGLAKSSWQELSQAAGGSSILGYTPGYAPPEQLAGKSTPLSDLYAVGATLYVLLTGRVPADAISRSSDVAVQEPDPLLPLDTLAKDLPPVVGRTIMQSLALRASDRPASAKAFAQQLQRWQAAVAHPAPAVVEKRKPEPVAHPVQETKPPEPAETPAARTTGDAVETMIDRSPVKPALPETKPPEPAEILTGQPNRDGRQIWLTETMIDRSPVKPAVAVKTTPEQPAETKHPVRRLPLLWVLGGVLVVALLGWFCWRVIQGSATLAGVGRTQKREKDGMVQVYVPAGCFEMGSTDGGDDEKPVHDVCLNAYWIDQTEVTNKQYRSCVAAGACQRSWLDGDRDYNGEQQPVVGVSWNDASAYCEWAGVQLPSEAQWEYAARGPQNNVYPWGNAAPDVMLANFDRNVGKTTVVGSYAAGASWVGALDMAGNVWEWVADWYAEDYYSNSTQQNPLNNNNSQYKVKSGGGWNGYSDLVRASNRNLNNPTDSSESLGFRCAAFP